MLTQPVGCALRAVRVFAQFIVPVPGFVLHALWTILDDDRDICCIVIDRDSLVVVWKC